MDEKWMKRIALFLVWPLVAPILAVTIALLLIAAWLLILTPAVQFKDGGMKVNFGEEEGD